MISFFYTFSLFLFIPYSLTSSLTLQVNETEEFSELKLGFVLPELPEGSHHLPISNITKILKVDSVVRARQALSVIILRAILSGYPDLFSEQIVVTSYENNAFFNHLMMEEFSFEAEDFPETNCKEMLRTMLISNGLFTFIQKRECPLVEGILKDIEYFALILCPTKSTRLMKFITKFQYLAPLDTRYSCQIYYRIAQDFIIDKGVETESIFKLIKNSEDFEKVKEFYINESIIKWSFGPESSLIEFGYEEEDLELFDNWIDQIVEKDCRSSGEIIANNQTFRAKLIRFLDSERCEEFVNDVANLGFFYLVAFQYENNNIQKILRLLDYRARIRADQNQYPTSKISNFWPSLAKFKNVPQIEPAALLYFQYIVTGYENAISSLPEKFPLLKRLKMMIRK